MRKVTNIDEFAKTAPWLFVTEVDVNASPEIVFKLLLEDNSWSTWHPEISNIVWSTPLPHGKGSKRSVTFTQWFFAILLFGPLVLYEEFMVRENNRRIGFCFNATNKPAVLGYRAGIEDFQLEPIDNGKKTRFRRIAAFEPSFLTSCIGFIIKPILRNVFQNAANNLKKLYD